jgi:hypothetical protein
MSKTRDEILQINQRDMEIFEAMPMAMRDLLIYEMEAPRQANQDWAVSGRRLTFPQPRAA